MPCIPLLNRESSLQLKKKIQDTSHFSETSQGECSILEQRIFSSPRKYKEQNKHQSLFFTDWHSMDFMPNKLKEFSIGKSGVFNPFLIHPIFLLTSFENESVSGWEQMMFQDQTILLWRTPHLPFLQNSYMLLTIVLLTERYKKYSFPSPLDAT